VLVSALVVIPVLALVLSSCGHSTGPPGSDPTLSSRTRPHVAGAPSGAARPGASAGDVLLQVDDPRINEASGIARSPGHPGVFYLHDDNATDQVFAVDATGTRAVLRLGVASVDWEDIASTPDGRIWIGDIGDNNATRPEIAVDVFTEPEVLTSTELPSTTYRLRYPDGPHNAEALLVEPRSHRVYVVTKQATGAKIYAAPADLSASKVNALVPLQVAPPIISGGDFAPTGGAFVLRTYGRAFFYSGFGTQPVVERLPHEPQGEGITFTADGKHVLLASEGIGSPVLRTAVPAAP
jgi:hypothetical protein